MKNLKKVIALTLTIVLAFGMLVGCGQQTSDEPEGNNGNSAEGEGKETYVLVSKTLADPIFLLMFEGFEEFKDSLAGIEPGENSSSVAELYARARNAMILIDGNLVNVPGVQLLADLGLITGKIGVPRNGMVLVTPGGNACGISHAGIHLCHMQLGSKLQEGKIKGAFIFGEDPVGSGSVKGDSLRALELLVVSTPFMTPTAELADVVLPASTPLEVSGTYVSGDGKIKKLRQVRKPESGIDNVGVIKKLAEVLNIQLPAFTAPEGDNLGDYVKYANGFSREGGKAKLVLPLEKALFEPAPLQDPAVRVFAEKKGEWGLK